MMNIIHNKFPTSDIRFIVFSLGGGTGGCISNMLADIMSGEHYDDNIKYNIIAVLPDKHETMLIQKNAIDSLEELKEIEHVQAIHLLDNDKVADKMDINTQIAILMDNITKANNSDRNGCFDSIEIEKCLLQKGFSVIMEVEIEDDVKKDVEKAIEQSMYSTWITDCKQLGYTLNARNRKEEVALKEVLFENFGMPLVDFTGFNPESNTNIIIASGMSFNEEVFNVLANRYNEMADKREKNIKEIERNEVVLKEVKGFENNNIIPPKPSKEDKKKRLNDVLAKYGKK